MFTRLCILLFITSLLFVAAQAQDDNGIQPPKLIASPNPIYPQDAKDLGIGGSVTVRVTVGASGEVLSVDDPTGPAQLCKGGTNDPRLVAMRTSAVDAVKRAKFSPAMKEGRPVKMTVWVTLTFDPIKAGRRASESTIVPVGGDTGPDTGISVVAVGMVTGRAVRLPKPAYPAAARAERASGTVSVRVLIDESGDVFTVEALSGHGLLRPAALAAACAGKFSPTTIDGKAVRVTGVVTYNFVP
jgi:TonB family protein